MVYASFFCYNYRYCIPTVRKTLTEISEEALLGTDKELRLKCVIVLKSNIK